MEHRNERRTEEELLHAFADLFDEVMEEDPEEIDAALEELGYDPTEIGKKMKAVAEQALAESPLNWRNRARQAMEREKRRLTSFGTQLDRTRAQVLEVVSNLLAQAEHVHGTQAVAHFRNFNEMTDEDLADLAEELEYLLSEQDQSE
jgi:hypothetical protein